MDDPPRAHARIWLPERFRGVVIEVCRVHSEAIMNAMGNEVRMVEPMLLTPEYVKGAVAALGSKLTKMGVKGSVGSFGEAPYGGPADDLIVLCILEQTLVENA